MDQTKHKMDQTRHKMDQTRHKVDQHTTRRALFDTSISFLSTLPKNSQNDKI